MKPLRICGIDVGIENLAYVIAQTDTKRRRIERVLEFKNTNITFMQHTRVRYSDCKLHHASTAWDWVHHFLQENPQLNDVDYVVIERQPPQGLVHVEQILFGHFRDRAALIHPRAIHAHFGLCDNYEERKQQVIRTAQSAFQDPIPGRQHDICDALLLIKYFVTKHHSIRSENLGLK